MTVRTILVIDYGTAKALTRNCFDRTDRYAPVVAPAAGLGWRSAVIGGGLLSKTRAVVRTSRQSSYAMANTPHRLIFFAFDLHF